jgi:hypothetical protein
MSSFLDYLKSSGPPPWPKPTKRKVFVSYHHHLDQQWYDRFSALFGDHYEALYDHSLDRLVDSDNPDYTARKIREDNIRGSSITIVLCGVETWKRKYVDWEIHDTLLYDHALLGIAVPTTPVTWDNKVVVPDRYYDNWLTGYAGWLLWTEDPSVIKAAIEGAISASKLFTADNRRPEMTRNL